MSEATIETLGDRFPNEIQRVKKIRDEYIKLPGGVGVLAAMGMSGDIEKAENAWAEQDTVAMIRLLPKLEGWQL